MLLLPFRIHNSSMKGLRNNDFLRHALALARVHGGKHARTHGIAVRQELFRSFRSAFPF